VKEVLTISNVVDAIVLGISVVSITVATLFLWKSFKGYRIMGIEKLDTHTIVEGLQGVLMVSGIVFAVATSLVIFYALWEHTR
jgi:hypothetical protein